MTDKFNKCIPIILSNEGGFVNDPDDQGGATNYGISLRFLTATGDLKKFDLDNDGDLDIDDIKLMTPEVVSEIYFDFFWKKLMLEKFENQELALQVFDTAVNAGIRTSVKLLQGVVGVKADGIMGIYTIAAANTFSDNIAEFYRKARKLWYLNLVNKNTKLKKFYQGWINRCDNTKF